MFDNIIDHELSEDERIAILENQNFVRDTVIIGGETFGRSSYIFLGKLSGHVHGCFSHKFYEAMEREGNPPDIHVVSKC